MLDLLPTDVRESQQLNVYRNLRDFYGGMADYDKARKYNRKYLEASKKTFRDKAMAYMGYDSEAMLRACQGNRQEAFEALRRESEQKSGRVRMLEDLEKNMEGYAGAVKSVMREARRGTLKGIHGPLSQLITGSACMIVSGILLILNYLFGQTFASHLVSLGMY